MCSTPQDTAEVNPSHLALAKTSGTCGGSLAVQGRRQCVRKRRRGGVGDSDGGDGGRRGVTEPLDYGINQKAAFAAAAAAPAVVAAVVHHPLWQNMLSSVGSDSAAAEGGKKAHPSSLYSCASQSVPPTLPPSLAAHSWRADRVSRVISISVSNILLSPWRI